MCGASHYYRVATYNGDIVTDYSNEAKSGPGVGASPKSEGPEDFQTIWNRGLKITCNYAADADACPVAVWNGYTYWAYSYKDNRMAFDIAAYDAYGNLAKEWQKSGARYVEDITVDSDYETVTFLGQAGNTVTMTFDEMELDSHDCPSTDPMAETRSETSPPAIPSGMKTSRNYAADAGLCPVMTWNGYTYWAFSYHDNRMAFNIAAYDCDGSLVKQWSPRRSLHRNRHC